MAVIHISEELIETAPDMFKAVRAHYKTFRELTPRMARCRTYEVSGDGIPDGDVEITPTIGLVDGEYVFKSEM